MPAAIRRGPRWTDFVRTVEEAVQAVRTPLTDLERAHGWTEDLWRVVRDHFEQQLEELRRLGPRFAPTYAGWVKSEVLDPGARDARWTAILRADDLALAFGAAEESIASAERLELLTHTESRLALASELRLLCERLASGEYAAASDVASYRRAVGAGLDEHRAQYDRWSRHGASDSPIADDVPATLTPFWVAAVELDPACQI